MTQQLPKRGQRLNGDGTAFSGAIWTPHKEPSAKDIASAQEFGNEHIQAPVLVGRVHVGKYFGNKTRTVLQNAQIKDEEGNGTPIDGEVMLPEWSSIVDVTEQVGMVVELEYEGSAVVQKGAQKGKTAYSVGLYNLDA